MTTPTNDRQTSERERLATVVDELGSANVPQWWTRKAADQLRADEAEIAQLRAERDEAFRMSRCECETNECCANLVKHSAELAALRAENEALRTVTEEDVIRTSARTGVMPTDVRKALQSFIRSKESRRG